MTAAHQFSYKVPLVAILDQPFLFNFNALMKAAARPESEIRKLIDAAILAGLGVRVLWWNPLGNNVLFSRGRDVADPERLKDQRVGAPGTLPGEFVAACGGKSVAMTIERFHGAYKDGALDMSVAGFGASWPTSSISSSIPSPSLTTRRSRSSSSSTRRGGSRCRPAHRAVIAQAAAKVEVEIGGVPGAVRGQGPRVCREAQREAPGPDARPGGRLARLQRGHARRLHGKEWRGRAEAHDGLRQAASRSVLLGGAGRGRFHPPMIRHSQIRPLVAGDVQVEVVAALSASRRARWRRLRTRPRMPRRKADWPSRAAVEASRLLGGRRGRFTILAKNARARQAPQLSLAASTPNDFIRSEHKACTRSGGSHERSLAFYL